VLTISKAPVEELLFEALEEAADDDEADDDEADDDEADEPSVVDPALTGFPTAALTAVTVPEIGAVRLASDRLSSPDEDVTLAASTLASSASIVAPMLCLSKATVFVAVLIACSSFWRVTWALASVCCAVVLAWFADVTACWFFSWVLCSDSWSTCNDSWSWVTVVESAFSVSWADLSALTVADC
jgi:hypothetical protein